MAITYSSEPRNNARQANVDADLLLAWFIAFALIAVAIAFAFVIYSASTPQYSHDVNPAVINDPTGVNGPTATQSPASIFSTDNSAQAASVKN